MTDGWRRPQPDEAEASTSIPSGSFRAGSPWWSDALRDPWRDPSAPATIIVPGGEAEPSRTEPVPNPEAAARLAPGRLIAVAAIAVLLVGTIAGVLGGVLGYTYATRGGGAILGADPGSSGRSGAAPPGSQAEVVDRVLPSVVTIRSGARSGSNLGSGFVISTAGHVITNDHVVADGSDPSTVTFHDGATVPATLVGRDPESDIAVLQVEHRGASPVEFGNSDAVRVGDPVLAMGSPLALTNTVTSGIVSAVDRAIQAGDASGPVRYYAAIQTDAAVNQGNSGGPLVDDVGRVIGINSVIKSVSLTDRDAANIGLAFAIPITHAKRVAQEIIDHGQARRTVIGAELDRQARTGGGSGVRLAAVADSGPAAQAGLRAGDVLTRLDGKPLEEPIDLIALVRKYPPGAVVTVEYRRGTARTNVAITLMAAAD